MALDHVQAMRLFDSMMEELAEALRDPTNAPLPLIAVHFGSTARGVLRNPTDIDLFIVFEKLEGSRFERQKAFDRFESAVAGRLKALREGGFELAFSPQLHTPEVLDRFQRIYLDFPEDGRILVDRGAVGEKLMERIRAMRTRHGMRIEYVNGLKVWNCRGDLRPGEPFRPVF